MTMIHKLTGRFFLGKINRLEIAFAVASSPFHSEMKSVQRDTDDHQKLVDAGKAVWEETTDDGGHYDYGEALGERRDDAKDALQTLRRAFTFMIYHQWERTAQRWSTVSSPVHKDLVAGAQAAGIEIDVNGLELLRLLVNTLKHNSAKCGPDLYSLRSNLFERTFDPAASHPLTGKPYTVVDYAERIDLSDKDIEDFFKIVKDSVPR